MPAGRFATLEADESRIPHFFDTNFPGVRNYISDKSLIRSLSKGPHQSIISIKCKPYHVESSGVVLGDAAHAMAPFYGQGLNAGMEDVRLLFALLDTHAQAEAATNRGRKGDPYTEATKSRRHALAEYSSSRWKDAHAINDLAMQNYLEMRASQSIVYRLRKAVEEFMHVRSPSLGWQTRYSRVVFSNEPYAECMRRSDRQGRLLSIFTALVACPCVAAGVYIVSACAHRCSGIELYEWLHTLWQRSGFWRHFWFLQDHSSSC